MTRIRPASGKRAPFSTDDRGVVTMIFGLGFLSVTMLMGAAIDFGRLATGRSALQQGTDAAVLAVAAQSSTDMKVDEFKKRVAISLQSKQQLASAVVTNATISADLTTLCATTQLSINNAFMQIIRVPTSTVSASTCANRASQVGGPTTYEVAFVLDGSGSMATAVDGVAKIETLRTVAKKLAIQLLDMAPGRVKISVVPFNTMVNAVEPSYRNRSWVDSAGLNSQHWIAFGGKEAANAVGFTSRFDILDSMEKLKSGMGWQGCFEETVYPKNIDADSLSPSDPESLLVPNLYPDEPDDPTNGALSTYLGRSYYTPWDYSFTYLPDNPSNCADTIPASDQWGLITHLCKYKGATFSDYQSRRTLSWKNGTQPFCPPASHRLLRLGSDRSEILNKIDAITPMLTTNHHTGFMWGWRTLSPGLPFNEGRSYTAANNRKIVIFMTDGNNFWAHMPGSPATPTGGSMYEAIGYRNYNGKPNMRLADGSYPAGDGVNWREKMLTSTNYELDNQNAIIALTTEACDKAKAKGIEIFSIGWSTSNFTQPDLQIYNDINQVGAEALKKCATNPEHFYFATENKGFTAAFEDIPRHLTPLRLSQ